MNANNKFLFLALFLFIQIFGCDDGQSVSTRMIVYIDERQQSFNFGIFMREGQNVAKLLERAREAYREFLGGSYGKISVFYKEFSDDPERLVKEQIGLFFLVNTYLE